MNKKFLYWFREDKQRKLETDIKWAINRFNIKFKKEPQEVMVRPEEVREFEKLNLTLNLVEDKTIQQRYFGIR